MPIVRYQIRNECGMADPRLYRAAERDDPEALLEGVAMAGLVGVLRQLGDLAQFAAEIFHDLHEQIMATSARGHTLMLHVQQLELEFPDIEKAVLSHSSHSNLDPCSGINWHPNLQMDQNLVTQGDMPRFILNSYEECHGPPQLVTLDKFDIAGAGACLKRYSDPSFFKNDFVSSGKMESEIQRERKPRKSKTKGLCLRNGEPLRTLMKPEEDSKPMACEKVSKNFFLKRVKLKTRPVNSVNTLTGRSHMERIFYRQPTNGSALHEDPFDQLQTKVIEPAPEVHEIMIDALSNNSQTGEREQIHSSVQQRVAVEDSDRLKKTETENSTKDSLLIPKGRKEKFSSVGFDNNDDFCGDNGTRGDSNYNVELRMKYSTESADVYVSDGVVSELDNYVDALTTMDSDIDTDTEGRAKPPSGLLNMQSQGMDSSGMLNCSGLCKENSALTTRDRACISADTQAPENNEASSCATGKPGTHFFVPLSGDPGENASKKHDVCSVTLHENTVAKERVILENKDDSGVHNAEEFDESSAGTKFAVATYDSCVVGSSLLAHGDPQAGWKENQSATRFLNPSTDGDISTFEGDPDPQQFANEQSANTCQKATASNHVGSTTHILEKFDVETICPAGITDVLSDKSDVQLYDKKDSNSSVTCSFIERETSEDFSMNNAHNDTEVKLLFVPPASVLEEIIDENISYEKFQELPSSTFQDHQCGKQYAEDDKGKTKVSAFVGESESSRAQLLLRETNVDPQREPQILSIHNPELEQSSDAECEVFHDAKLQVSSSDNLQTYLADGSSERLDNAGTDGSLLDGADINLTTLVPETHVDAFSTDKTTTSYNPTAENGDMFDSSKDSSTVISPQVLSVAEFKLEGEFSLQDSASDKHNLKRSMISCPQNDYELDSQNSLPSIMDGNIKIVESHDICMSMASSLKLRNAPKGDLLKDGNINLGCDDVNLFGAHPSDAVNASEVKCPPILRLQDDISSVIDIDENNQETSSQEPVKEGIRGLSAQRQHNVDDQQFEEAKPGHSSDVSSAKLVAIPAKKEIQESGTETYIIPHHHIPPLPDPHSSESPISINYVDNDQSGLDKYVNLRKENEVGLCFSKSNQGSDSVSFLHESFEDNTIPASVLPMSTTARVQPLDWSCSASVEAAHSFGNNDASSNRLDLDKPLVSETQFDSAVPMDTSLNNGHICFNGYNCDHSDIEDHFPSQSSVKLSARSMCSVMDREPQKPSLGPSETEKSSLHDSHITQNDTMLDNALDQFETGTHALHVCSSESFEKSLEYMDQSNVLSHNECTNNHMVVEAHVSTQSSSESLLVSSDNNSDTPVQTLPSFNFTIPNFSPFKISDPVVGYDQPCSIPFAGHNVLARPMDGAPPLPPLPPLQWRLGKTCVKSGMPAEAKAVLSYSTRELVSDIPRGNPNLLAEEACLKIPSTDNKPKSEDVRFKHDFLDWENTRVDSFVSKPSEGTNDIGTTSPGGERTILSESFGTHMEGQKYHNGQEDSNKAKQQPANLFVPVAVSCNETNQYVSSNFGEPAKPLNSFVLVPILEQSGPQGTDPALQTNLTQPLNRYLFGSAIENGKYHYGCGDLAEERIQPINIPMSSDKQGSSFMDGGIDAYAPYSLFSAMDSGKPNGKPHSILNRPRDPLIEAVASHDKSTLRKVSEMAQCSSSKPKVCERDMLLEQIRNKSFNLKPAVATKPNINTPMNLNVSAILEKANTIRQAFVGSDEDDDDNWSDC